MTLLPYKEKFDMVKKLSDSRSDGIFEKSIVVKTPNVDQIWSIMDVARYTGYAVGTLYNLVSDHLIPFRKKRGKLYFIPFEIQNWIEEGDI